MDTLTSHFWAGFLDETAKLANTRYNKEIAKGTITRAQLVPEMTQEIPGILGAGQRKVTHDRLIAYEPPTRGPGFTAENAARLKELQATAQLKNMGQYAPGAVGHGEMTPGLIANTAPNRHVFVGPTAGPYIRTATEGGTENLVKAQMHAITGKRELVAPDAPSIDSHIRQAVVQHEGGEAAEMARAAPPGAKRGHASHLGVKPILQENIALSNAPEEAVDVFRRLRQGNPDDAMTAKLIRRAGGTPNAPLPVDGRAQRALEGMYDKLPTSAISPATRSTMYQRVQLAPELGRPVHMPPAVAQNSQALMRDLKYGIKREGLGSLRRTAPKVLEHLGGLGKYLLA